MKNRKISRKTEMAALKRKIDSIDAEIAAGKRKVLDEKEVLGKYAKFLENMPEANRKRLELLNKLTANSKVTDKDIMEISRKINAGIARWHEKRKK